MSRLSDLRAALDEMDSAKSEREQPLPVDEVTFMRRQARVISASKRLWDTVDTDTIRSLVEAAEAAERESPCPFCRGHRDVWVGARQPHGRDCPLATLVEEADDESDRIDEYDWRKDLEWLRPWTLGSSADQAKDRLAAYIERLEAERDALQEELDEMRDTGHWLSDEEWHAGEKANEDFLGRYNALLAEHEASRDIVYALGLGGNQDTVVMLRTNGERESVMLGTGRNQDTVVTRLGPVICRRFLAAHDNAERVMRGE